MAETVAERLAQTLIEAGVRRVYGIVGDSLNPVTDAIRRSETVDWIHVCHEEAAAFAAAADAERRSPTTSAGTNDRCALGIAPEEKRIRDHLANSLMLVTALNPHIGYEKSAQISLKAYREDLTLRDAALKLGFVTAAQFDKWVRPEDMTHPLGEREGDHLQSRY